MGPHDGGGGGGAALTLSDLYVVPRAMRSEELSRVFEAAYHHHRRIRDDDDDGRPPRPAPRPPRSNRRLTRALWAVASPAFVPAGFCQLVVVACNAGLPLLIRGLIRVFEGNIGRNVMREGLPYAFSIFATSLVNGFANHRHRHLASKAGARMRGASMNAIYDKCLRLGPVGRAGLSGGEVSNLLAVDAQKLYEVTQEGHLVWALPLSVFLVSFFLCETVGPSALAGIAVLVGFVPIVERVTAAMMRVRSRRVVHADERVDLVSGMLRGMRTTKLNNMEGGYLRRVTNARNAELVLLSREMAVWATTLLMMVVSPILATATCFTTYVLADGGSNVLTTSDAFGVLLLFLALRFPINFAGRLVGKVAQANSAAMRISAFLDRPSREEDEEEEEGRRGRKRGGEEEEDENDDIGGGEDNDIDDDGMTRRSTTDDNATTTRANGGAETAAKTEQEDDGDDVATISGEGEKGGDAAAAGGEGGGGREDVPLRLVGAAFRVGGVARYDDDEGEGYENDEEDDDGFGGGKTTSNGGGGFKVSTFDFSLKRGEVLAVCGPVGSGKSTLLNGILGEARSVGGPGTGSHTTGNVSYAPQAPFVLNMSLRDNVLFGRRYDPMWYEKVLDACCLLPDLEQLDGGDATEIGERGVTLSGGQKQRVSLARAAYAAVVPSSGREDDGDVDGIDDRSSLVILDDPFSALDSGTGADVFDRLIGSPDGLLRHAAVLIVTHASHLMTNRAVGRILLIVDGRNRFVGTWDELAGYEPDDDGVRRAVDHIRSSVREKDEEGGDECEGGNEVEEIGRRRGGDDDGNDVIGNSKEKGQLIQAETREHGLSSVRTWLLWFKRAGGLAFFLTQLLFMAIDRLAYVAVDFFLAFWTSGAEKPMTIFGVEFPPQTDGPSAQAQYLRVYWIIILVSAVATFLRSEWGVVGGGRATRYVFNSMLVSVLRAPMSYFEMVPMGRILNRFTYDTDVNDINLTQVMSMLMISCSWYVAGVIIQCSILPWCFFVIAPVSAMYFLLMRHYRLSGPDLQRLDALSRSPLQSMVSEGLEGSTSIRVFCQAENFVSKFRDNADANCSALLNFVSAQRWLAVRMELLGSAVVLVSSVLVVCLNESLKLDPGLIGILILWSANFTITLNFLVDTFSDAEASITSIERVDAMAYLPSEKAMKSDESNRPPSSWPEEGLLEFVDVSLRYRPGLPLSLDGLSFKIPAGKTCGVVGRTGAGKSSLAVALFRLVEVESGRILLDGVDLGTLGLCDVRGRGMAIIPQDPFLAGATIRDCLDPFGQHGDEEIMDALASVRLGNGKLLPSMKLEEGGSNFSVGECQLLNLARALLSQPKLLVLDEATASIDGETDAFIQKMLRTRFSNTTLVTIAHRINTIMDYDLLLVMDAGRAVEFGSPAELLGIPGGVFSELVDAAGGENSKALRAMAIN